MKPSQKRTRVRIYFLTGNYRVNRFCQKGTEAILFPLYPRPTLSHLTKPNTITLLNLLPEPVISDRLAIMRRLTDQVNILPIQVYSEEFSVGMATLIMVCAQGNIPLMSL